MADSVAEKLDNYETEFKKDYMSDWDVHRNYITNFDAYEAMLVGQVYDSVSNSIDGSKITDSYAATLAMERAARVMGKLPDGFTEPTAKADQGKAAFMDILRQKWIYPNANAQHSFETKLRLWQLYSSVYGYMPMFYDWNVSSSGYVGPDCWLWSPRNLIPQQGRTSIKDMDYVTALTWVGKKQLETILGQEPEIDEITGEELPFEDGWDRAALDQLIDQAKNESTNPDTEKDTQVTRDRQPQSTKKGICLATRYEAGEDGEWVTFAPDHGYIEVRRLLNPHKNGRIPFVIKYSQALFDNFYGLGDFQRAKPLQFARDGLTNFYFQGIKMALVPPIVVNSNGVLKHTVDYRDGGVIMETIPNSVRVLQGGNTGLSTYQGTQTALTGSLLSLFGSQNASAPGSDTLNPSQGKTPAAIGLYSDKEATRDGQERYSLEEAIEELTDGFFSLVVNIGSEEIPVNLFSEDIEEIEKSGLTDVMKMFTSTPNSTGTGMELRIDPAALKDVEYRFSINNGSTAKQNKDAARQAIQEYISNLSGFQNLLQNDPRVQINWDKITKAFNDLSDIPGADEFITVKDAPSPQEQAVMDENNQLKQQLQQLQQQSQQSEPEMPEPTINEAGMFQDPHLGQAAQIIHKLGR